MQEIKTELVIIGAGPGGLSAALYARRAGLDFEIVEKKMAGGQIINTDSIENYPGFKESIAGFELAQNLVEHCRRFDVRVWDYFPINSIEKAKETEKGKTYSFKCQGNERLISSNALIIATGASPDRLSVEGEDKFIGRGISFSRTLDRAFLWGKEEQATG